MKFCDSEDKQRLLNKNTKRYLSLKDCSAKFGADDQKLDDLSLENSQMKGLTRDQLAQISQMERIALDDRHRIFCDLCGGEIDMEKFYKHPVCGHIYHQKCAKKMLKMEAVCPVESCRVGFNFDQQP